MHACFVSHHLPFCLQALPSKRTMGEVAKGDSQSLAQLQRARSKGNLNAIGYLNLKVQKTLRCLHTNRNDLVMFVVHVCMCVHACICACVHRACACCLCICAYNVLLIQLGINACCKCICTLCVAAWCLLHMLNVSQQSKQQTFAFICIVTQLASSRQDAQWQNNMECLHICVLTPSESVRMPPLTLKTKASSSDATATETRKKGKECMNCNATQQKHPSRMPAMVQNSMYKVNGKCTLDPTKHWPRWWDMHSNAAAHGWMGHAIVTTTLVGPSQSLPWQAKPKC